MCTCVTFNLIFTTTHFKRVPKLLLFCFFFLLLTKWLKLQPFPDSPSCRTCNQENTHSASRAGLVRTMSSSLQMCTRSSEAAPPPAGRSLYVQSDTLTCVTTWPEPEQVLPCTRLLSQNHFLLRPPHTATKFRQSRQK